VEVQVLSRALSEVAGIAEESDWSRGRIVEQTHRIFGVGAPELATAHRGPPAIRIVNPRSLS
jgi:hypothetical protein